MSGKEKKDDRRLEILWRILSTTCSVSRSFFYGINQSYSLTMKRITSTQFFIHKTTSPPFIQQIFIPFSSSFVLPTRLYPIVYCRWKTIHWLLLCLFYDGINTRTNYTHNVILFYIQVTSTKQNKCRHTHTHTIKTTNR